MLLFLVKADVALDEKRFLQPIIVSYHHLFIYYLYLNLPGNHSAGKSSFINWYVEEHIQKTGVAIETQGFTFITSGRRRESLTGTGWGRLGQGHGP